jgi:hypothetical protein
MDARDRYDDIADFMAERDGIQLSQMMGMPCIKSNGKMIMGFTRPEEAMVFKLPEQAQRDRALALEGAHLFDPSGKGQPFKEWVVVPFAHAQRWEYLAEQALHAPR